MNTMPQNEIEERFRWISPVLKGELAIKQLVSVCPFSERTVKYWLANYRKEGLSGLANKSREPHASPNKTSDDTYQKVVKMRKDYHIGGKKIFWKLNKQGAKISEKTVNRILNKEGLVRRYRTKRKSDEIYQPEKFVVPGQMIEIDVKYGIRLAKYQWWYQFTAKDKASCWRFLQGFESQNNYWSLRFLERLLKKAPFRIQNIKTDNDGIFTNRATGYSKSTDPFNPRYHVFDLKCIANSITHYLIDPGKPRQQGAVENSHSLDKRIFYKHLLKPKTIQEYQLKLTLWNMWYNDLENIALDGLTPNEYLYLWKVQNVSS